MNVAKILEDTRAKLSRRFDRQIETLNAVYDDDLWSILESHGLLEKLDSGELTCYRTDVPLTRENVGGIIVTENGLKLISDSSAATVG